MGATQTSAGKPVEIRSMEQWLAHYGIVNCQPASGGVAVDPAGHGRDLANSVMDELRRSRKPTSRQKKKGR